ncbi:MAG TPA: phage portal protein, partial [Streptosporangiaceae bacterium]|nr:phage portal protein [Streptosporangiaceae bacterium]
HSAVWACLRLRADLISTFPVDVFRRIAGAQVQCPKSPVLVNPAGRDLSRGDTGIVEWLYSSQVDLDRAGNAIGLITARDGLGLPSRIELAAASECSVQVRGGKIWKYRIGGTLYDPGEVWHERAFTVPGLWVGLSPVAYAAWAIGEYLSVQQFAVNWFSGGAVPRSHLKNTAKTINPAEALVVKEAWRAAITVGEPWVHGSDWDYEMIGAAEASQDWLEAKKYSITDIGRFFGVPADMIDSAPTGATRQMTYANISQRNLQLLIMNLGPALIRREAALTGITPRPRYVKFSTDALLRLDPAARAAAIQTQIDSRTLDPNEARELENRPPLTEAQIELFARLFPAPGQVAAPGDAAGSPSDGQGIQDQGEIEPGPTVPAIGSGS